MSSSPSPEGEQCTSRRPEHERHPHRPATHQEDFTQALSILTAEKYEPSVSEPPRLLRIARLAGAQATDPHAFRLDLLTRVAFNTIIGNGDAHSKNYSILLHEDGTVSMAPLYDAAPVFLLSPSLKHSGHALAGRTNLRHIGATHLVRAAVSWGSRRTRPGRPSPSWPPPSHAPRLLNLR